MKIIGKNSVAKFLNWGITFIFILFFFHLIYFVFGYSICYYNKLNNPKFLENTFSIGVKLYNGIQYNTFSIKYPFTNQNFFNGVFGDNILLKVSLGFAMFTFYFYSLKNIFNELSTENIFSTKLLKWTKIFLAFNIIVGLIYTFVFGNVKFTQFSNMIFHFMPFLFVFLITLFAYAFFKKGLELQNETDLTI